MLSDQWGGMSQNNACNHDLAFIKAVFFHIIFMQMPNSEASVGLKTWCSMQMAKALMEYTDNNWVEHPKMLSILVLTTLAKEGKCLNDALMRFHLDNKLIAKHTLDINQPSQGFKKSKEKSPSLQLQTLLVPITRMIGGKTIHSIGMGILLQRDSGYGCSKGTTCLATLTGKELAEKEWYLVGRGLHNDLWSFEEMV